MCSYLAFVIAQADQQIADEAKQAEMPVLLATPDFDLGLVPFKNALAEAKQACIDTGQMITARDHISDQVLFAVRRTKAGKFIVASEC